MQAATADLARFGKVVKLAAFSPFQSAQDALENINCISEGVLHDHLRGFLEANLVPGGGSRKSRMTLGVSDPKIGAAINEVFHVQCETGDTVNELIRGVRMHFAKLITGLADGDLEKAQLGLAHSYSRAKVKFNVNRVDNMIIQAISLLDQLDKDINTFSMRIREWYGYHFPELVRIVNENYQYAQVCRIVGNRKTINNETPGKIEAALLDSAKAHEIIDAARSSMGMDVSDIDLVNILTFANRVVALTEYRKRLHAYLVSKMNAVAPNLSTLIGEQVGARLISHAGSLTNLAKYPASTVQILGAEKALFRALKTRGNTPKYGLIFHSSFIGRAAAKNKGRISRYLANKCSIASRIDCFSELQTAKFGEKLREQVEERLRFYETGAAPRRNLDVIREVLADIQGEEDAAKKRKKEKRHKRKHDAPAEQPADPSSDAGTEPPAGSAAVQPEKRRRKHHRRHDTDAAAAADEARA